MEAAKINATDSADETEIVTASLDPEDAAAAGRLLSRTNDADRKAADTARLMNDPRNLRESSETDVTRAVERETCNNQLADSMRQYGVDVQLVLNLAEKIDYDAEGLEYRRKIDVDRPAKRECSKDAIVDDRLVKRTILTYRDTPKDRQDGELLEPLICLDQDTSKPKVFVHSKKDSEVRVYEIDDEQLSFCSCVNEDDDDGTTAAETVDLCSGCVADTDRPATGCRAKPSQAPDYERDAIRDDLMAMKGGVKLLGEQNKHLLSKLNGSNQRKAVLFNVLRGDQPPFLKSRGEKKFEPADICNTEPDALVSENNRLREELKEMKRDRCQIELAKKILNVADSQCSDCVGSSDRVDAYKNKFKALTAEYNKLLQDRNSKMCENENLQKSLDDAKHKYKSCEDCLAVTKSQVNQLEKQLFHFISTKSNDAEVLASNEKYLIKNLRHRSQEAAEEKASMQMVLDFHLSELEDKKAKYLAVLQTNEGQRHRIDTLCKEKSAIAKEYETQFSRMNEHLKSRLEEIEKLPGLLAATQRDLEKEKSARTALENERDVLLNQIDSLKVCLAHENSANNRKNGKELEGQNLQLKATIVTLEDALAENERLYMERTHDSLQLKEHLDAVREEAAVQVTKIKDFSECQKHQYTDYIQKLEQQLAESRALACAENQKRDHVDDQLRSRIDILTDNLNEANKKIKELFNAKEMIETKLVEDVLCKIPQTVKSSYRQLNTPKTHDANDAHNEN